MSFNNTSNVLQLEGLVVRENEDTESLENMPAAKKEKIYMILRCVLKWPKNSLIPISYQKILILPYVNLLKRKLETHLELQWYYECCVALNLSKRCVKYDNLLITKKSALQILAPEGFLTSAYFH